MVCLWVWSHNLDHPKFQLVSLNVPSGALEEDEDEDDNEELTDDIIVLLFLFHVDDVFKICTCVSAAGWLINSK